MMASSTSRFLDFHRICNCVDNCPLLKPGYAEGLWRTVKCVATQSSRCFGPVSFEEFVSVIRRTSFNSIPVVDDWYLHNSLFVEKRLGVESNEQCYNELARMFDRYIFNSSVEFSPCFELHLWCAVNSLDAEVCRSALAQSLPIPACVLSSLLLRAIRLPFAAAALGLLKRGASPNAHCPIHVVMRRLESHQHEVRRSSSNLNENGTSQALSKILEALIDHGADLYIQGIGASPTLLHQISTLALCSPDTYPASRLIAAVPANILSVSSSESPTGSFDEHSGDRPSSRRNSVSNTELDDDYLLEWHFYRTDDYFGSLQNGTALTKCLYEAAIANREQPFDAAKILNYGLLPLLRAGAVCEPDPLEGARICIPLADLIKSTPEDDKLKDYLWGKANAGAVVNTVLEMRQKGSLNVEKLLKNLQKQYGISPKPFQPLLIEFASTFRQHFPRPLQATCRLAILRRLPLGAVARQNAILQLKLPAPVFEYLSFSDLEIKPGVLV